MDGPTPRCVARAPDEPAPAPLDASRAAWRFGGVGFLLFGLCLLVATLPAWPATGSETLEQEPLEIDFSATAPSQGVEVLRLGWGDGDGEVGRSLPTEGLPRGPQGLAVGADGRIAVLDSLNRRVILQTHGRDFTVPIPLAGSCFIAAGQDRIYVLDSEADHRMVVLDWAGRITMEVDLPEFPEPVTALLCRNGRVYVELLHEEVYEIPVGPASDPRDQAPHPPSFDEWRRMAERLPGRPLAGLGKGHAQAALERPTAASILLPGTNDGGPTRKIPVDFAQPIDHLVSLDAARPGEIILGARLLGEERPAGDTLDLLGLVRLRPGAGPKADLLQLRVAGGIYLGPPCVVGGDGHVYQPGADEEGFFVLAHRFPNDPPLSREV